MESLAFSLIGLVFGIVLCLIAFSAFLLYRAARDLRGQASLQDTRLVQLLTQNSQEIHALKTEVSAALTKLDAAQLHEAALSIQRSALRLARAVGMLHKLAFAQEGAPGIAAAELDEADFEGLPADPQPADIASFQNYLRQRAEEKSRLEQVVVRPANPLPDIQDGHDLDAEENATLGLRSFMPEGL
jgi:hypothetical protein